MANDDFKICPFCKEQIRKEAVKCRYCGEWLEHPLSSFEAEKLGSEIEPLDKVTEGFTRPNNENIPVQEPQPEDDQAWLETVAFGANVFRDLQESLNINPSREQWEHEFLTRLPPQEPIPREILDALWNYSSDAKRIFDQSDGKTPMRKDVGEMLGLVTLPSEKGTPATEQEQLDSSDSLEVSAPNSPVWQPSAGLLFRLRLVSVLLLVASVSILLFILKGLHGDPQKISELITFFGKMGMAAFLLWFSFGKKKGFGVLLFAIFCFLFTVYADWHAVKTKKENVAFDKFAANGVALFEQATNPANFTPEITGSKNVDQFMAIMASYSNRLKQLSTSMEAELQSAGEPDVYSKAILNDSEKIRSSINIQSKRQAIIESYRVKGHGEIDSVILEFSKMDFSNSTGKEMAKGFNSSIAKAKPQMDEWLTLRSNLEAAKERFLQFMLEKHGDYKLDSTAITFNKNTDSEQYGTLTKTIDDDAKALDDLIANMLKSANATKETLKKMSQ